MTIQRRVRYGLHSCSTILYAVLLACCLSASSLWAQAPADIAIIGMDSDTPDRFAFVALSPLPAGTTLSFTDNGWQASGGFRANEGIFTYTAPSGGLNAGTVVTVDNPAGMAFSTSGDQILVYTGSANNPTFIYALNAEGNSEWQADATNSNTSALPPNLSSGTTAVAVAERDNVAYTGPTTGTRAELLAAIGNPANWQGSDTTPQTFATTFTVTGTGGNLPPVFVATPAPQDVVADEVFTYTYVATDPENEPVTYAVEAGPGTIDGATGQYTWTPSFSDVGLQITLTVSATGGTDRVETSTTFTVRSEPSNTAPAFTNLSYPFRDLPQVRIPTSVRLEAKDPDGDALQFSIHQGDPSAVLETTSDSTALLTFTPMEAAVYPFKITVSDGQAGNPPDTLLVAFAAEGQLFPSLNGEALRAAIASRYAPSRTLGYNLARDTLYRHVERSLFGLVRGIYSNLSIRLPDGEDPSSYLFDRGLNAEHIWPQSEGAADEPQRSDMHNLYPSRTVINSARANLPFGSVPAASAREWYLGGGVQSSPPPLAEQRWWSRVGNAFFEPNDTKKGVVARAMAYFLTMYPDVIRAAYLDQQADTLATWNERDPGDMLEVLRSARIAQYQGNINPFVLDPTLMPRILGRPTNTWPVFTTVLEDQEVTVGQLFSFDYEAEDLDGDNLFYTALGNVPAGLTIDIQTGVLNWTPTADQVGQQFVVTIRVNDPQKSIFDQVVFTVLPSTVSSETETPRTFGVKAVYPNPIAYTGTLVLSVDVPQRVRVVLHDVLGRRVALLADQMMTSDASHLLTLDTSHVPSGVYVVTVEGAHSIASHRLVVSR